MTSNATALPSDNWRYDGVTQPIVWHGDLGDDCTALWAGLMLRAEWMNGRNWWWCVYDCEKGNLEIASSNSLKLAKASSASEARTLAENAAMDYLRPYLAARGLT